MCRTERQLGMNVYCTYVRTCRSGKQQTTRMVALTIQSLLVATNVINLKASEGDKFSSGRLYMSRVLCVLFLWLCARWSPFPGCTLSLVPFPHRALPSIYLSFQSFLPFILRPLINTSAINISPDCIHIRSPF